MATQSSEQPPEEEVVELKPDEVKTKTYPEATGQNEQVSPVLVSPILKGSAIIPSDGHIRGGQIAYNTGAGFYLGYDDTAYKFSIGDEIGRALSHDWPRGRAAVNSSREEPDALRSTVTPTLKAGGPRRPDDV